LPVGHLGRLGKQVNAVRFVEREIGHIEAGEDAGDQSAATPCPLGGHCQMR